MPRDSRIGAPDNPVAFSCDNYQFQTNVMVGYPHSPSETRGSVVSQPLIRNDDGYTLWLEHVTAKNDRDAHWFWLMWYDGQGLPTMPMSAVFDLHQLGGMIEQLISQREEMMQHA
jgi:hypothetical protein